MNKRKKSKLSILLVLGIFAYFAYIMFDQQKVLDAKGSELRNLKVKIEEQARVNEDLEQQKQILNSDENVERMAREKLGMVKQGEKVFVDVNK